MENDSNKAGKTVILNALNRQRAYNCINKITSDIEEMARDETEMPEYEVIGDKETDGSEDMVLKITFVDVDVPEAGAIWFKKIFEMLPSDTEISIKPIGDDGLETDVIFKNIRKIINL